MEQINTKKKTYCRCFFCAIKEPNPKLRQSSLSALFTKLPFRNREEDVLVTSALWSIAMANPKNTEIPFSGALRCMSLLLSKSLSDPTWLRQNQNIYIPYYAAHVLGSYTLHLPPLASLAVQSGAIPPLLALLRGALTWVEQRVAVRTLGHLASFDETFPAVASHAEELVGLAVGIASGEAEISRKKYHSDLLTRGLGGAETEERKAEEWARQLVRWSVYLLSCFASRGSEYRFLICGHPEFLKFLKKLGGNLWGSPAGVGLVRILLRSRVGRAAVAGCREAVESLCSLSRSTDTWRYMGIDCLLLLIDDPTVVPCLVDLAELRGVGPRKNVGEVITRALLEKYEIDLFPERGKRGDVMSAVAKREAGNESFFSGDVEEAVVRYTEALDECPLRMRKERMVLYSNRAQCRLLMRDPDAAISDATRALSLSETGNGHGKSLWRRAQAYDMKGMARESLMDCIVFVGKGGKVPDYAARMIEKQMSRVRREKELEEEARMDTISGFGLPTIEEEPRARRGQRRKGKEEKLA